MDESTSKTCTGCSLALPLSEFHRNKRKPDGLQLYCKVCAAELQRQYRRRKPEKMRELGRENMRRRRATDPEGDRDYMRAWREMNADLNRSTKRAWEQANYERVREYANEASRRWKAAHPDLVRAEDLKRRALKAAVAIGAVDLDALWVAQAGLCGLCGEVIDKGLAWPDPMSASVDHIVPLSLGGAHSQDNLQWTHLVGNVRKGNRTEGLEVAPCRFASPTSSKS